MEQRKLAVCGFVTFVCVALSSLPTPTQAVPLDKEADIRLGVRTYVNARIGTERTDRSDVKDVSLSQTFPQSEAGHLRQNRIFTEAALDHDLDRLVKEGFGPFELLNHLPFKIRGLKYHLAFRGEGDSLYDWGPSEYSSSSQYRTGPGNLPGTLIPDPLVTLPDNPIASRRGVRCTLPDGSPSTGPGCRRRVDVYDIRHQLRKLGTDREQLFLAYMEGEVGNLFVRFGRQVLSWGETDGFRLLDQINPIDSSFGGFLISLDERRVPLDMLRTEYRIGQFGPVSEMAIHMFGAIDNRVGFAPGTPAGSPWTLPNNGTPSATTLGILSPPHRSFTDIRGGGRLYWNMFDATFSIAHYYTHFDTPALQVFVKAKDSTVPSAFPLATFTDGYSAHAYQSAPQVQVSGATTTFALEKWYSVVRSELAYFKGEPRFHQSAIDPFVFVLTPGYARPAIDPVTKENALTGGRVEGNSLNYVLGLDSNQYVRFLNPYQTFFISTQIFYKHLMDPTSTGKIPNNDSVLEGEVLPVPEKNLQYGALGRVEPQFIRQHTDQFLQTLFISTSYRSGTVNPNFVLFYDWSGAFVYAPAITFIHDPWRFTFGVNIIDAGRLKGDSGVSLLRDRDNVLFQFEYSI